MALRSGHQNRHPDSIDRRRQRRRPKFSPDGVYLSYIRDHNLYVRKVRDTTVAVRLTDSQADTLLDGEVDWVYEEELDVRSNYFWSPDSRRVAYLQMNEASVPEYPIEDWIPNHADGRSPALPAAR